MESAVIGTVEVVLLVVGLVELIKTLGLEGRSVVVSAFVIATLLGGMAYAIAEGLVPEDVVPWLRVLAGALWVGVKGLAAAGLVKFTVSRAERVIGQGLAFALDRLVDRADEELLPFEPTPEELARWQAESKGTGPPS